MSTHLVVGVIVMITLGTSAIVEMPINSLATKNKNFEY
jgi:hypothetical protein